MELPQVLARASATNRTTSKQVLTFFWYHTTASRTLDAIYTSRVTTWDILDCRRRERRRERETERGREGGEKRNEGKTVCHGTCEETAALTGFYKYQPTWAGTHTHTPHE